MMVKKIEDEIKRLEEKKRKIRKREIAIKEMEKKRKDKSMVAIGKLAYQAGIADLDGDVLLGAFLEIALLRTDEAIRNKWLEKTKNLSDGKVGVSSLSISFSKSPDKEVREKLKEMKFKWNDFRGEYYGYGNKEEMRNLLHGVKCSIEVLV